MSNEPAVEAEIGKVRQKPDITINRSTAKCGRKQLLAYAEITPFFARKWSVATQRQAIARNPSIQSTCFVGDRRSRTPVSFALTEIGVNMKQFEYNAT